MKAEKSRELFTVVKTFTIPCYGIVELVTGNIRDVIISESPLDKYKGSCYRCCFRTNCGCKRPNRYCLSCINDDINYDAAFYRRKTAENVQK